jgi:tetratricopeptide (TPR) repeat protein
MAAEARRAPWRVALLALSLLPAALLSRAHAAGAGHATHLPATLEQWAEGAQLFEGLGNFHRGITTSSPLAQQYFDQGMRLMWAFNHDEATRSFAAAARADPACASCFWGVALAVGPNYNFLQMDQTRAAVAWRALELAQQNAPHASPVEQALIGALAARYGSPAPLSATNIQPALTAYAAAMREVASRFGDDLDVQTLCAEARMSVHAWHLWSTDGEPAAGTLESVAQLEAVLRRAPDHPGANHYYVHVMEESAHPERALAAAERLKDMMPAAGHMVHMPAHILQRVGLYEEAAAANRRAIAADRAYLALVTPPGHYAMYLGHNYAFLAYAAAMEGRKAESLAAVQGLLQTDSTDLVLAMDGTGWNLVQHYAVLVRFGLWDEMLAIAPPDPRLAGLTAGYLYARGVALAARGRTAEAQDALAQLQQLPRSLSSGARLERMLSIAEPIVAARIAATSGRTDAAVAMLRQAAAAEDRVPYNEPADWFFPVRHLLGAQLLIAGRPVEAEQVYREDLRRNPHNGWALYGLAKALQSQGRTAAAQRVSAQFRTAWQNADVRLPGSAFWFAGADDTHCECQRDSSPPRAPSSRAGGS